MSVFLPKSNDIDTFWQNIVRKVDCLTEVPATHWLVSDHFNPDPKAPDRTYSKRGAFLDPVPFDPLSFGMPPTNLTATDPAQLLALMAARNLLDDIAGNADRESLDLRRTGIVLGTSSTTQLAMTLATRTQAPVWRKALLESGLSDDQASAIVQRILDHYVDWQENSFPGLLGNIVAGRIANRFGLHGMNCIVDAACASSLAAISVALNELYLGNADMMLTGGVDILNDPMMYLCFSKTPAMSPTGDCRPFAADADGTMMGEGVAMLALKRLSDAERDGNAIYCLIRGLGSASDGASTSVYAPVAAGQARSLRQAYLHAGYSPQTVELVEAHGTATRLGDKVEFEGLTTVFPPGEAWTRYCALGSVKSQFGHTKAAAGATGMVKAVLSLHHKILPPTLNVDAPNELLDLESSAFYLNTEARPWISARDHPRRASVSSFGFGGTNYHVALEEYLGSSRGPARAPHATERLLLLSTPSPALMHGAIEAAIGRLQTDGLSSTCRDSLASHDSKQACRMAVVARDLPCTLESLELAKETLQRDPERSFRLPNGTCYGFGAASAPRIALLFSGQGSQHIGMGTPLVAAFEAARRAWDEAVADPALAAMTLREEVFPPPTFRAEDKARQAARLTATDVAQPALAVTELAVLALLRQSGLQVDMTGGHSFGELVALHAAGVYDRGELLRLACARGRAMAETATKPGAMLSLAADASECAALIDAFGEGVWMANLNAPRETVASGATERIDAFATYLEARGVHHARLQVGAAFHTPLMTGAARAVDVALASAAIEPCRVPVYSNVSGRPYRGDAASVRAGLVDQVVSSVRFSTMVQAMADDGADVFIEVGPGSILTRLVAQILHDRPHLALASCPRSDQTIGSFLGVLGALAVRGVALDLSWLAEWDPPRREKPPVSPHAYPVDSVPLGRTYPPQTTDKRPIPARATALPTAAAGPAQAPVSSMPLNRRVFTQQTPTPVAPVSTPMPMPRSTQVTAHPEQWRQLRALQEQSAAAHTEYLRALTAAHEAYLQFAGQTSLGMMSGHPPTMPAEWRVPEAARATPDAGGPLAPAAPLPSPVPAESEPVPSPAVDLVPSAAAIADEDPVDVLLDTVAQSTGYPKELLKPEMDLEGGLGIDSIKRVQIFASLRERYPELASVDPSVVGDVRTLQDILNLIAARRGQGAAATANVPTELPSVTQVDTPSKASMSAPATTTEPTLHRYLCGTVDRAMSGSPLCVPGQAISIVSPNPQDSAVAAALASILRGREYDVEVDPPTVSGGDVVVYFAPTPTGGAAEGIEAVLHAMALAKSFAPRAAAADRPPAALLVIGDGNVIERRRSARVWFRGFCAFSRTLAAEWPRALVKYVDLLRDEGTPDVLAALLVDEIIGGAQDAVVGLGTNGRRCVPNLRARPVRPGAQSISDDAVVVVSGGARGITAAALHRLSHLARVRVAILGRTALSSEPTGIEKAHDETAVRGWLVRASRAAGVEPALPDIGRRASQILAARTVRRNIDLLAQSGAEVRYFNIDIRDREAVFDTVAHVRRDWGPVSTLIHGAGVVADRRAADKVEHESRSVLATKLVGLENLLDATERDPLSLICLFSSVVGRTGNAGQSDYAFANAVLDDIARTEATARGSSCVVKSIAWGPWNGGLVTDALAAHFRDRGWPLIDLEAGTRAFVDEISDRSAGAVDPIICAGSLQP
jgi:acyl transferase domain-containing protein/NADP-dependent 3-hydroxy acid dehydrogenase YdfG